MVEPKRQNTSRYAPYIPLANQPQQDADDPANLTPSQKQKLLALNEAFRALTLEYIKPLDTPEQVHYARCHRMTARVVCIETAHVKIANVEKNYKEMVVKQANANNSDALSQYEVDKLCGQEAEKRKKETYV